MLARASILDSSTAVLSGGHVPVIGRQEGCVCVCAPQLLCRVLGGVIGDNTGL